MYQALKKEAPKQQAIQKKDAKKPNHTGIPDTLKAKYENHSGFSFDDVKIHYNSDKPAQFQALAYTQGNQVFVAPKQEMHLEHELGHVVQQKQGIVKPTGRINNVAVNEDKSLEKSADRMVQKSSLSFNKASNENIQLRTAEVYPNNQPVQCEKILNIASGTDVKFLVPYSVNDKVLNTDRGDMIYLRFIIDKYQYFKENIMQDIRLVLSEKEADILEADPVKSVNYWFYTFWNGNIELLWEYITYIEQEKEISFIEEEGKLYDDKYLEGCKEFKFGTILDEQEITEEEDKYDTIMMISGYNVPILRTEAYANKIYSLLKTKGKLKIIGNKSCLKTNGIEWTGENIKYKFDNLFAYLQSEFQPDTVVPSQHTLTPSTVDKLVTVVFQKKA